MPKKIRFFIEYFRYYLRTYALVILLGIICGSLIYSKRILVFNTIAQITARRDQIGLEGLYTIKRPPTVISNLISYGLTSLSANNKPVLSKIVEKMDVSEDELNYTFHLKQDLVWHNGKKFRSSDLDIDITGATTTFPDQFTVQISLQTPFSPLLSILSQPLFYNQSLIGLGEYKVAKTTFQDGYIKTLELVSTKNSRDLIVYHFYANGTDLLNAFKLGEVTQISTNTLDKSLDAWPKTKINPVVSSTQYLAIFLNNSRLGSKTLRQALAYATPKTNDNNNRCLGPIAPNSWAYNSQIKPYYYNIDRAKELLDKEHPTELSLTITDRELLPMAELIKKSWTENLGINIKLSIENQKPDLENYDAILTYGIIPSDPDQYSFWHSTQTSTNITHFNNSRIDKLLEEGRLKSNQIERKQIYTDFQKFLLEESPVIFLEFPTTYNISRIK